MLNSVKVLISSSVFKHLQVELIADKQLGQKLKAAKAYLF